MNQDDKDVRDRRYSLDRENSRISSFSKQAINYIFKKKLKEKNMIRHLFVLIVLAGTNYGARFNAKVIERNFTGIYNEIREIEKSLESYHNRMERLSSKSQNDTMAYNQLLKRLENLHAELDRIKKIQKQELDNKTRWKTLAENNSRLIYNFRVHLQNQINKNQKSLFSRLARLELRYNTQQQSVLNLEQKLDHEVAKNTRLTHKVSGLKDTIRKMCTNMTSAITKLRRKHNWLASRIHNKSAADTEMMRYYRRFAEELQKQIYALDQKIAIEQKETPLRLKELLVNLLAEITEKQNAKTTSASVTGTTTTKEPTRMKFRVMSSTSTPKNTKKRTTMESRKTSSTPTAPTSTTTTITTEETTTQKTPSTTETTLPTTLPTTETTTTTETETTAIDLNIHPQHPQQQQQQQQQQNDQVETMGKIGHLKMMEDYLEAIFGPSPHNIGEGFIQERKNQGADRFLYDNQQ